MTDQIKETSQIGKSYRGWMQLQEATGLKKKFSIIFYCLQKKNIFPANFLFIFSAFVFSLVFSSLRDHQVYFFYYRGCPGQLVSTSTNLSGPEVNDYVSLQ